MTQAIGLFGGAFDPIHLGHLILAEALREACRVERVLFVPTFAPRHRPAATAPYTHRLEMIRRAVADHPCFEASDLERRLGAPSYTIRTVEALGSDRPIVLFVGADSAATLDRWHRSAELLRRVQVAVAVRPGTVADSPHRQYPTPAIGISSTAIRERLRGGRSVRYLLHPTTADYISSENLYLHRG